jgi:hypothetical protein
MAREHNYLIGNGEKLTGSVDVPKGGGDKNPPYAFAEARSRLAQRLSSAIQTFNALPVDATPDGQVVALVSMHPRYVSKSDYPQELLAAVGLRTIGSRSKVMRPDAWGVTKHPDAALTEQIFVAGAKDAFSHWMTQLPSWSGQQRFAQQIQHVETLAAYEAGEKLRIIAPKDSEGMLEVVLHNAGDRDIIDAFVAYAKKRGANVLMDHARDVRGLTFLPVHARFSAAEEIARFSFVRVARAMPSLRPIQTAVLRSLGSTVQLPTQEAADQSFRAVVFDGGLPAGAASALSKWVTEFQPQNIGKPVPAYQDHGLAVTTALLFGPLQAGIPVPQPLCKVDHVRVLDDVTGSNLEYIDVLDRIVNHLDRNPTKYAFVNISIGPNTPAQDDEVTYWTASLDQRFAHGRVLATVAVGNEGEADAPSVVSNK